MMDLRVTPSFRLDGRSAVVTGATKGLGLGCATALADAGARVTLLARTASDLEQAVDLLRRRGTDVDGLALDVTDYASVSEAFDQLEPFDILVNNAGTNRPGPMLDVGEDDYDAVLNLNLKAAFFVSQAVIAKMRRASRPGSLIHLTSQMGHVGAANRSLYCASKWALEGLSKSLAVEFAPHGIRSNTIAPTFIETPLTRPYLENPAFRAEVLGKIKLGRIGDIADVMGAVVFLASDASSLMTGSSIVIDGGWTAE